MPVEADFIAKYRRLNSPAVDVVPCVGQCGADTACSLAGRDATLFWRLHGPQKVASGTKMFLIVADSVQRAAIVAFLAASPSTSTVK